MLQEGDGDAEEPSFHGGTEHPDKHDEKPENRSSSKSVILIVLLVIIVIVAVLLGAYYYRHSWYKGNNLLDFR
jgi:Ca2+/H+ antiporter